MPNLFARSIVRESLVLATAAAIAAATLTQGMPSWFGVLVVTAPTAAIILLRRWWGPSVKATIIGGALGIAMPCALFALVQFRSARPIIPIALICLGLIIGAFYGLITGLALKWLAGPRTPEAHESEPGQPRAD